MQLRSFKSSVLLLAIFTFGLFTDFSEIIPENFAEGQEIISASNADLSVALVNNYSAEESDTKVNSLYTLDFLVVLTRVYTVHVQTCFEQTNSLEIDRYKIPVYLHLLKILV